MRHTAAFWDRLRLELTQSLRCTEFTSFASPLFGLKPSTAHARLHSYNVAKDSLEERAGVIAEVIELARQTSLDLLEGVHATPDTADLLAHTESLVAREGGGSGSGSGSSPVVWRRISLCGTNYCEVLSPPVLTEPRPGKKRKVVPGRSFLYDVRGTASAYELLASYVMCRDHGDGAVTALDVAGNPVPGGLLQWVDKAGDDSVLTPVLRAGTPPLWDAHLLTGALLLLPRAPHDTTRALHAPLVGNIVAHGHYASVRTLLKVVGPGMLDWERTCACPWPPWLPAAPTLPPLTSF